MLLKKLIIKKKKEFKRTHFFYFLNIWIKCKWTSSENQLNQENETKCTNIRNFCQSTFKCATGTKHWPRLGSCATIRYWLRIRIFGMDGRGMNWWNTRNICTIISSVGCRITSRKCGPFGTLCFTVVPFTPP